METARKLEGTNESSGGRLVSVDGRTLPLKGTRIAAEARGGIARVTLEQRFVNPYDDPLAVTYLFPLPADGAVSGFAFTVGDKRIVGEVDRKEAARERYEQALIDGHSAALVEQDRSSLFSQEIGNIPPRAEVVAELVIDQRLAWIDGNAWEWRFPTAVAPRYLGASGRVADAGRITVDVADGELPPRLNVSLGIGDALAEGRRPESPSHAMRFVTEAGRTSAALVDEQGAPIDRDVVVRWPVSAPKVGLSLEMARPAAGRPHADAAYGLLTIVPPSPESKPEPLPRDLIVLLDTSGSMSGEPLAQAKRIASALVDSLTERDRLELIEFSSAPRRFKRKATEATESHRREALAWIGALEAGGGTEMREGVLEALKSLRRDAQRQVVLVTDGLIGFETEVVATILEKLPPNSRFHTVGVGSAVNRSLTGPAARAGRGIEAVIGLGEDPERAAQRLLARTEAPIVTELELAGEALLEVAPTRMPDLFAGAPVLVALKLRPEGGELVLKGRAAWGTWQERVRFEAVGAGTATQAPVALFGREQVEDLEMRFAAGTRREEIDPRIEKLGVDFQISTRLTSWIAVSEEKTVDPRKPVRRERIAHQLPHGMSAEGLGLREAVMCMPCMAPPAPPMGAPRAIASAAAAPPSRAKMMKRMPSIGDLFGRKGGKSKDEMMAERSMPSPSAPREEVYDEEAKEEGALATLFARIVLLKGRDLVIELTVDADGLEWDPSPEVQVLWPSGTPLKAHVDTMRTTAPASLAAGQVVRLALRLEQDAPKDKPRYVYLTCGGVQRVIELQG